MNIIADTHAHTLVSGHAYNTMKEMIHAAAGKGLKAVSLTEHAPNMPGSCSDFYFMNLKVVPRIQEGVRVFLGTELNILDETGAVDLPQGLLEKLDIVIASIHPPCYKQDSTMEDNTSAYINAMKNPHIHIIGHPDDNRFPYDMEAVVKMAKETHTLLEVNNSSLNPNSFRQNAKGMICRYLELCKQYEVSITLGSDAHVDADVGNFENALQVLKECGFPEELIASTSIEKLESYLKKA